MLSAIYAVSITLSVANKQIMLSVFMLNVIMLNVILLNVLAPNRWWKCLTMVIKHYLTAEFVYLLQIMNL